MEVLAVDGIMEQAGDVSTVGNELGDEVVTVSNVVEKSEEVVAIAGVVEEGKEITVGALLVEGEEIVVEEKG